MTEWVDNFTDPNFLGFGSYKLVDLVDTGLTYAIAGGKCTIGVVQEWLDDRYPAKTDGTTHYVSVTVDDSSGPPFSMSVGWAPIDYYASAAEIAASLGFHNGRTDYSAEVLLTTGRPPPNGGGVSDGDNFTLAGLVPPYTLKITADTAAQSLTMDVTGNVNYHKQIGGPIDSAIWDYAWANEPMAPFINVISFAGPWKSGTDFPPVVLKQWLHDTNSRGGQVLTPSNVKAGNQQLGAIRTGIVQAGLKHRAASLLG